MTLPQVELWMEVEPSCNLHCQFCYNWWREGHKPSPLRLSTGELLAGLRDLSRNVQYTSVTLSGGEPLLRDDLGVIVEFFSAQSVSVILATNGILLSQSRIYELNNLGVGTFQLPLHSTSEDMHDQLAGGRSWRRALEALVDIREAGAKAVVVFVATNLNISGFPRVVALCGALGLSDIIFNRLIPSGMAARSQSYLGVPGDQEISDILFQADSIAREAHLTIHLGVPVAVDPEIQAKMTSVLPASCPISRGQRRWTIGADGTIRRCSHAEKAIGTILDGGLRHLLDELLVQIPYSRGDHVNCCHII